MLFTMYRDFTLRTRAGLIVTFKKDAPTHVPPKIVKEALAAGARPVDPAALEHLGKLEQVDRTQRKDEAIDPIQRESRIKEMLEFMRTRNLREYFTAAGSPSLKHLSLLCGFEVDKQERDKLWHAVLGTEDDEVATGESEAAV